MDRDNAEDVGSCGREDEGGAGGRRSPAATPAPRSDGGERPRGPPPVAVLFTDATMCHTPLPSTPSSIPPAPFQATTAASADGAVHESPAASATSAPPESGYRAHGPQAPRHRRAAVLMHQRGHPLHVDAHERRPGRHIG
ncbi:hypothetical protein HYPSUDRAFT_208867 [Hypholoma sublateritium FD-334 SS-4]|uniref:Uncharacterized protein n=1 Tax=Hypholoma sublateritium (strain FD-334 SS-4) TaxID=945553 RepID=A0A0D2N505_HYPSF|nr:hypothetical protein HYPSUDRAFT_208867 [Hypholoma sublateritium FD-334 SS-4]